MRISTNRSTRRKFKKLLALFILIPAVAGCAATELTSLDTMQNRQVRMLALACYHNSEGFRLVYGSAEVWKACRVKVEQKVRPYR